jgi:hypothetical protein
VGTRLVAELDRWVSARAALRYAYAISGNRAALGVAHGLGGTDVGGYAYLVLPATARARLRPDVATATGPEVHRELRRARRSLRLLSDPHAEGRCPPGAGAWLLRRGRSFAGCSAISNQGILGEVVERLPRHLEVLGPLLRRRSLQGLGAPHLPKAGEELRSWYVHDFFATDPSLARELAGHVLAAAYAQGRNFCHFVLSDQEPELEAVRRDHFAPLAPVVRYHALARRTDGAPPLPGDDPLYVDPRDV